MSWVRVDDKAWSHPKFAALSGNAVRLWMFALCWSNGHETDGFIPSSVLRILGATKRQASELEAASLWVQVSGGWQIHDFLTYQPSAAENREKRENKVRAGRAGGERSAEARRQAAASIPPSRNQAAATTSGSEVPKQNPTPDPVPDPDLQTNTDPRLPGHGAPRPVRCPTDLRLTDDQISALGIAPGIDRWSVEAMTRELVTAWVGDESAVKFPDHWRRYLLAAIKRRWSDPSERPVKPRPEADPNTVRAARERREAQQRAETRQKLGLPPDGPRGQGAA